ncbi:MAG: hypothetical protein Ct9H90mP9_3740 [Pseudomonadota bacterium]|nr:MAG: hypothetical protein Ct9H90mP9_3740 [Pseudomonadota bacterium]
MAVAETYTPRAFSGDGPDGRHPSGYLPRAPGHIPEQLEAIEKMIGPGWPTKSTDRSISM